MDGRTELLKRWARDLDGQEYPFHIDRQTREAMVAQGVLIAYGASDDLLEFDGVWRDEVSAYRGAQCWIRKDGKGVVDRSVYCECEYGKRAYKEDGGGVRVAAKWNDNGRGPAWTVIVEGVPHETFMINDDGEPFCRAVVFFAEDCKTGQP